jgi:carboxymethylenebutenolidase
MSRSHFVVLAVVMLAFVGVASSQSRPQDTPAAPAIPPDAEHAAQALEDSPRHSEWVDIALPSSGSEGAAKQTKLHTWIVYPEREDKAPIVIVIHKIFGLTKWVRAVADQLAADGFIAVAPDLLSGMGPDGGGTESLGDKAGDEIRKLSDEETARRLDAALEHALKLPSASDKAACIGFGWGGSASFAYAARQPKLKAAVVYYGTAPMKDGMPDKEVLAKINCPVIGLYGTEDNRVTSTVFPDTVRAMRELDKSFSTHAFDGAGHGFLRQQTGKDGAELMAQGAWADTLRFLRRHLNQR